MTPEPNLIVCDADGVLLDERVFWYTAVETALALSGVQARDVATLCERAVACGLQRVTKSRGCNSNLDLAAVLAAALGEAGPRALRRDLASDPDSAVVRWAARGAALWCGKRARAEDPLAGFGISRGTSWWQRLVAVFDDVLQRRAGRDGGLARAAESRDRLRRVFDWGRTSGFGFAVCTGRSRDEVRPGLQGIGLLSSPAFERVVGRDDVEWAEKRSGRETLAKPHSYSLISAIVGRETGLGVLTGADQRVSGRRVLFAGDALADFNMARDAVARGWPVEFIHVRSGVTTAEQDRQIDADAITAAAVDRFSDLPAALTTGALA